MASQAAFDSINDIVSVVPEGTLINMKMNKNESGGLEVELSLDMGSVELNAEPKNYGFDSEVLLKAMADAVQQEHSKGLSFYKKSGSIVSVTNMSSKKETSRKQDMEIEEDTYYLTCKVNEEIDIDMELNRTAVRIEH